MDTSLSISELAYQLAESAKLLYGHLGADLDRRTSVLLARLRDRDASQSSHSQLSPSHAADASNSFVPEALAEQKSERLASLDQSRKQP